MIEIDDLIEGLKRDNVKLFLSDDCNDLSVEGTGAALAHWRGVLRVRKVDFVLYLRARQKFFNWRVFFDQTVEDQNFETGATYDEVNKANPYAVRAEIIKKPE
jgi:hypothetical protein